MQVHSTKFPGQPAISFASVCFRPMVAVMAATPMAAWAEDTLVLGIRYSSFCGIQKPADRGHHVVHDFRRG